MTDPLLDLLWDLAGDNLEGAEDRALRMLADYSFLCGNWIDAPEWACWFTRSASGVGIWHEIEPTQFAVDASWWSVGKIMGHDVITMPAWVGYALCKWQRSEESE